MAKRYSAKDRVVSSSPSGCERRGRSNADDYQFIVSAAKFVISRKANVT